jgi:hypothetical protein
MKTAFVVAALLALGLAPLVVRAQNPPVAESGVADEIRQAEERFRLAKLSHDVATLERILNDAFVETNQNGRSRDKRQTIDLFRTFPIESLTTDRFSVRVSHNVALVTGSQTERNNSGIDRMLFTRVYVGTENGWELVSSSQFRDPRVPFRR